VAGSEALRLADLQELMKILWPTVWKSVVAEWQAGLGQLKASTYDQEPSKSADFNPTINTHKNNTLSVNPP
jgi:hypothetical protein